ncbi:MAG: hypothetical protein JWM04_1126 [Verrucomicrobiales bacterium]|nr:hypothetical protein [Verrucomicrobiales bacterium]
MIARLSDRREWPNAWTAGPPPVGQKTKLALKMAILSVQCKEGPQAGLNSSCHCGAANPPHAPSTPPVQSPRH